MLLHLGADVSVPLDKLLFVVNERGMTPTTRAYIERAKKARHYEACAGKPKSYAVSVEHGREVVHASNIASATLEKRWRESIGGADLSEAALLITQEIERK